MDHITKSSRDANANGYDMQIPFVMYSVFILLELLLQA